MEGRTIENEEWEMEKRVIKKRSKYQQSGTERQRNKQKKKINCSGCRPPLTNHRRPLSLTLTPHVLPFTFTLTLTLSSFPQSTVHTSYYSLLHSFSSVLRSDSSSLCDRFIERHVEGEEISAINSKSIADDILKLTGEVMGIGKGKKGRKLHNTIWLCFWGRMSWRQST